jgi:hypothetical protein
MNDTNKPLRTVLSDALTHLIQNWRTTAAGLLTLAVTGGAYLTVAPPPGFTAKEVGWATFAAGLAKVWLSLIQKDGQGPKAASTPQN